MKTIISPSILGSSFSNMEKVIGDLNKSNAEYIHFDVMDGDFVPNLTFGPQFISNLRDHSKKIYDVHLMINRVNKYIDDYINSGSDIITFHLEINEDINMLIKKIKSAGKKCGISIKPDTSLEDLEPYLDSIDQVLVMTVEPGFGGQTFMNDQIKKIEKVSNYISTNNLSIDVEVDGGINYDTGKLCVDAGANILVAGSFLFKQKDLIIATNDFQKFFNS
tara:strand:- start:1121 stop:1780 length:660 start_codon:yes stop_codon:yes gene_type:complete